MNTMSKGEVARRQLLDTAMELFAEHGVAGTTTRMIAKASGQNIGAIAYYFQSKEGLYQTVIETVAARINAVFITLLDEINDQLENHLLDDDPMRCLSYIKQVIRQFCYMLSDPNTLNISKLLFREQLSPTDVFQTVQVQALLPIHKALSALVSLYSGLPKDSLPVLLHSHAILGEVLAFRAGRETILLRTGWKEITEKEAVLITETLIEHLDFIMNGLRAKYSLAVIN